MTVDGVSGKVHNSNYYADMAVPLQLLTNKGQIFIWGEDQDRAFHKLKAALFAAPVLAIPFLNNCTNPLRLLVTRRTWGQMQCWCKTVDPVHTPQRKIIIQQTRTSGQKGVYVYRALSEWRCFVEGTDCTVVTDHNALIYSLADTAPAEQTPGMMKFYQGLSLA